MLDTGVDKSHPFLAGKVVSEACYSSDFSGFAESTCPGGDGAAINSGRPCSASVSGCDHGTHVAGIAAGHNGSLSGVAQALRTQFDIAAVNMSLADGEYSGTFDVVP